MLNRLTTRVAKLKQVLEDILNDDQEMEDMYLGRRAGGLPAVAPFFHPAQVSNAIASCTVKPHNMFSIMVG